MSGVKLPNLSVDFGAVAQYHRRAKKPRWRSDVTIAAGFVCSDGLVLCTDSEHTAGQSRFYEPKIFEIRANNALLYLAGAGSYVYIRAAAQAIEASINTKSESLDHIKSAVVESVSDLYVNYLHRAQQAGDITATLAVLLAVRVHGEPEALLYRVEESGGLARIDSGWSVVGTDASESVFREQADLLCHGLMSIFTMRHLGPHIIRRVCKFAAFCGGSPQVACLQNGTDISYFDNSASPDSGRDYLSDALIDLPYILECCISPTERNSDLDAVLARFNRRLIGLRQRRLNYLAGSHPANANAWSW